MVVDQEVIIAIASSGYVEYEHWKKKDEALKLERHSGRIVFRKIGRDFKHDGSFNKSILLDFAPSIVKAFKQEGFYFTGSRFGKNYIGFAGIDGSGEYVQTDFTVSDISTAGSSVLIFDKESGSVYTVDSSLKVEPVDAGIEAIKDAGMSDLSGGRLAFFKGTSLNIYNSKMQALDSVDLVDGNEISAVGSVKYGKTFEYRKFDGENLKDFIKIYEKEEDSDSDNDDEVSDDGDMTGDEETEDAMSDDEASDDETDPVVDILDASGGDVIWIASKRGNFMAYDLKNKSWLVRKFSESEQASTPSYYNEMRPYINSTYVSFPKDGQTNYTNAPAVSSVYSVRGLPYSITYRLVFEGHFAGTESKNGMLNNEKTVLKDISVDFSEYNIDPQTDSVILMNRISSNECMIPFNTNAAISIIGVISSNELEVSIDKYADQIETCYGSPLSYAVFSNGRYAVSRETFSGVEFAGKGVELESSYKGSDFSFVDEYAGISIKRKSEDVVTAKGTSFFIKLSPGVPFEGFSSGDVVTILSNPAENRLLLFSPLTRRVVEYNIIDRSVSKIYK